MRRDLARRTRSPQHWKFVGALNDSLAIPGYAVIGVFVAAWALPVAIYRMKGYDRLDPPRAAA